MSAPPCWGCPHAAPSFLVCLLLLLFGQWDLASRSVQSLRPAPQTQESPSLRVVPQLPAFPSVLTRA